MPAEQARRTNLDEYGRGAESDCAKAMAEVERVLHELSLVAVFTLRSSPGCSSSANETPKAPSLVPAPSSIDRLTLDPDLDFVIHDDGMIELTAVGFRRMLQAHSAGLDAVIVVDRREVLRLPAPRLGHDPCAAGRRQAAKGSPRCADLIEAHVRRTQPVAELLKAEQSSEMALNMINEERERREVESLLPWYSAGTLNCRDAERIERALAADRELAQRFELVREELAETIRLNEMLGAPSERAMDKLFAAIEAEEARAPARGFSAGLDLSAVGPRIGSS